MERPAAGVHGFLLWNPIDKEFFFRIYHPRSPEAQAAVDAGNRDPENVHKDFTDYTLDTEELEVELLGDAALYDGEGDNPRHFISWQSGVLGHKIEPGAKVRRMKLKGHKPVKVDGKIVCQEGIYDDNLRIIWKEEPTNGEQLQ